MAENPIFHNPSPEGPFAPLTPQVANTIIKPAPKKTAPKISNKKTGAKRRRQTTGMENANSGSWLTIISNLVLLLAIFAIIFSAQRALHNNKTENVLVQQTQPAATAVEQTVEKESQPATTALADGQEAVSEEQSLPEADQPSASATSAPAEEKESSQPATTALAGEQEAVSGEQSVAIVKEELPVVDEKPVEAKIEPKQIAKERRPKHDPYTSGGPLDLDRTSGQRDTWNAGGTHDLDSETARIEYKKSYLSSTDSDK